MSERVEQLLTAGNEASARVRNLWITFLLFGTYLAIAIGGTTHQQMLLEEPLVLPILGAELPLVDFYQVAPVLFLVFHFYLMVQLYLLAQKLHLLEDAITGPAVPKGARGDLRARTDNFLITQLLVGKTGGVLPRLFIRWAAWLTMIFAPVLLLLAFQVQFLAYHDVFTTWLHRATLIADVLIVWLLWPVITHPGGRLGGVFTALFIERPLMFATAQYGWQKALTARLKARDWRGAFALIPQGYREIGRASNRFFYDLLAMVVLVGGSLAVIGFSVLVATIPAEEMERWLLDHPLPPEKDSATGEPLWWLGPPQFRALQVAEGEALPPFFSFHTWTSKRPRQRSVPVESEPNAVWWPTAILFEGEPDRTSSKATSLFSRNLMLIDDIDLVTLSDADLAKTDRTLVLRGRDLRHARFDRADLRKADMFGANLAGAVLAQARLEGVNLEKARMQGTDFSGTKMQGANLREASMQGADLSGAILHGAQMDKAELQGASFVGTLLRGASLVGAKLQATDFSGAEAQAASFTLSDLRGSVLDQAQLHSASFKRAHMQAATLRQAVVWPASLADARVHLTDTREAIEANPFQSRDPISALEDAAAAARQWLEDIPVGRQRDDAQGRLTPLIDRSGASIHEWKPSFTETLRWRSVTLEQELGALLGEIACEQDGAPNIARGLLRRITNESFLFAAREHHGILARAILRPDCAGARGLTDEELASLREIAGAKPE